MYVTLQDRSADKLSTEAYRMNKRITEDPMANYVDGEL